MYNVTFSYPAFNPTQSITIRAQLQGDTDKSSQAQVLLFTMDGLSLTRNKSKYTRLKSTWNFSTVSNIEEIRNFFRSAEGQYIRYSHYDGSEWNIIVIDESYPITSSKKRASYVVDGQRYDHITHDFSLSVERWAA